MDPAFDIYLDSINITSEDINFDEIDLDLSTFQEDETVQLALQRGVDLKKYGRELEKELKLVCICINIQLLTIFIIQYLYSV